MTSNACSDSLGAPSAHVWAVLYIELADDAFMASINAKIHRFFNPTEECVSLSDALPSRSTESFQEKTDRLLNTLDHIPTLDAYPRELFEESPLVMAVRHNKLWALEAMLTSKGKDLTSLDEALDLAICTNQQFGGASLDLLLKHMDRTRLPAAVMRTLPHLRDPYSFDKPLQAMLCFGMDAGDNEVMKTVVEHGTAWQFRLLLHHGAILSDSLVPSDSANIFRGWVEAERDKATSKRSAVQRKLLTIESNAKAAFECIANNDASGVADFLHTHGLKTLADDPFLTMNHTSLLQFAFECGAPHVVCELVDPKLTGITPTDDDVYYGLKACNTAQMVDAISQCIFAMKRIPRNFLAVAYEALWHEAWLFTGLIGVMQTRRMKNPFTLADWVKVLPKDNCSSVLGMICNDAEYLRKYLPDVIGAAAASFILQTPDYSLATFIKLLVTSHLPEYVCVPTQVNLLHVLKKHDQPVYEEIVDVFHNLGVFQLGGVQTGKRKRVCTSTSADAHLNAALQRAKIVCHATMQFEKHTLPYAIVKHNAVDVERFLREGTHPDRIFQPGQLTMPGLVIAVSNPCIPIIQSCLRFGARFPMVMTEDKSLVMNLVKQGVNLGLRTLLLVFCRHGSEKLDLVRAICIGCRKLQQDNPIAAYILGAYNHLDILNQVFEDGNEDVFYKRDEYGRCSLVLALEHQNTDVVRFLCTKLDMEVLESIEHGYVKRGTLKQRQTINQVLWALATPVATRIVLSKGFCICTERVYNLILSSPSLGKPDHPDRARLLGVASVMVCQSCQICDNHKESGTYESLLSKIIDLRDDEWLAVALKAIEFGPRSPTVITNSSFKLNRRLEQVSDAAAATLKRVAGKQWVAVYERRKADEVAQHTRQREMGRRREAVESQRGSDADLAREAAIAESKLRTEREMERRRAVVEAREQADAEAAKAAKAAELARKAAIAESKRQQAEEAARAKRLEDVIKANKARQSAVAEHVARREREGAQKEAEAARKAEREARKAARLAAAPAPPKLTHAVGAAAAAAAAATSSSSRPIVRLTSEMLARSRPVVDGLRGRESHTRNNNNDDDARSEAAGSVVSVATTAIPLPSATQHLVHRVNQRFADLSVHQVEHEVKWSLKHGEVTNGGRGKVVHHGRVVDVVTTEDGGVGITAWPARSAVATDTPPYAPEAPPPLQLGAFMPALDGPEAAEEGEGEGERGEQEKEETTPTLPLVPASSSSSSSSSAAEPAPKKSVRKACKFGANCRRNDCWFQHNAAVSKTAKEVTARRQQPRMEELCHPAEAEAAASVSSSSSSTVSAPTTSSDTPPPTPKSTLTTRNLSKSCKYGLKCWRTDCWFKHPVDWKPPPKKAEASKNAEAAKKAEAWQQPSAAHQPPPPPPLEVVHEASEEDATSSAARPPPPTPNLCLVCEDASGAHTVCVPCGHMCVCRTCAAILGECPHCRAPATMVMIQPVQ